MFRHLLAAIATVFRRPAPRLKAPPMFALPDSLVERYRYRAPRATDNEITHRRRRKVRMRMQRESRRRNRAA